MQLEQEFKIKYILQLTSFLVLLPLPSPIQDTTQKSPYHAFLTNSPGPYNPGYQAVLDIIDKFPIWVVKYIFSCHFNHDKSSIQVGIQMDCSLSPIAPIAPLPPPSPVPSLLVQSPAFQLGFTSTDFTPKRTPSTLPMLVISTFFSYTHFLPQALKPKTLKKATPNPTSLLHGFSKFSTKHITPLQVSTTSAVLPHAPLKTMSFANNIPPLLSSYPVGNLILLNSSFVPVLPRTSVSKLLHLIPNYSLIESNRLLSTCFYSTLPFLLQINIFLSQIVAKYKKISPFNLCSLQIIYLFLLH